MKRGLALLGLLLAACSQPAPDPGQPHVYEQPLDDGRWTVINYWATWCAPCREEIPELNRFAAAHADSVAVYAVNFDGVTDEELRVQATELGITFPLLSTDPANLLGYARPTVLPTTLVITPAGGLSVRLIGPQTEATLEEALGTALD
jgi:thiol-disulfide isomerase/thioredoxin